MLFLISLGLFKKEDMSLDAFESIKKCDSVYFENYTNFYKEDAHLLSKFLQKEVKEIERKDVEEGNIVEEAKKKDICLLVIGDIFSATTHMSLFLDAAREKVKVKIIHGSSIFSAIAETGLSLYRFGAVVSIPKQNEDIKTPFEIFMKNKDCNYHTLFLLDIIEKMNISDGIRYLVKQGMSKEQLCVGCWQLGGEQEIKFGSAEELMKIESDKYPQCFIVPANNLHFMEEDALERWKLK